MKYILWLLRLFEENGEVGGRELIRHYMKPPDFWYPPDEGSDA